MSNTQKENDFDLFKVKMANGKTVTMTRQCLFSCYLRSSLNKASVLSYTLNYCAI